MKKEQYFLYIITNKVNRKQYIGWTGRTPKQRLARHFCESRRGKTKSRLYKAIRKYGTENFLIAPLLLCASIKYVKQMEIAAIQNYDTLRNGYNSTIGGDGVSGYHYTKEQRKTRSINTKKWRAEQRKRKPPKSPKKRAKLGSWCKGIPKSDETKKKLSNKLKGRIPWNKGLKGKNDPRNSRSPEIMEKTHSKTRGIKKPHKSDEMKTKWSDPSFREMMIEKQKRARAKRKALTQS